MLPTDMFTYVKKKVLNGPEPSRPRPRSRPTKTRQSALNSAAVQSRYGMSEATLDTHRAASAARRKSTVYGDFAAMAKVRDAVSTGVKTAQDTVNKLSAPCDNDLEAGGMPKNLGSRRGSCVNLTLINSSTANMTSTAPTSVSNVISTKAKSAETSITDFQEVSQATKMKQYAKPTAEENARCKVCFKKFGDGEFFKLCCSCERKVCDDCSASYGHKNTASSWTCSICQRRLKNEAEDGCRARFCTLRSAGMAVVAQNRFKTYSKRQDSFHFEKMDLTEGLSVPNEQARRHSTGNVGNGTINIAALQPNLENLKKSPKNHQQQQLQADDKKESCRKTTSSATMVMPSQGSYKGCSQQKMIATTSTAYLGNAIQGLSDEQRRASFESGTVNDSMFHASSTRSSATDIRLNESHQEWQAPQQHIRQNEQQMYHHQVSGEGIQIVVDEPIDSTHQKQGGGKRPSNTQKTSSRKRLTLYNDSESQDFGLNVVGRLEGNVTVGLIVRVMPGGPAYNAGMQKGDKILEWDGLPLSTVPIDDIPEFVEESESQVITVVLLSNNVNNGNSGNGGNDESYKNDNEAAGGSGGCRRRLPSLPPSSRGSFSTQQQPQQPCGTGGNERGWIQLGLCFEDSSTSLIVTLWSAEGLRMMETAKAMALPKPYAIVRVNIYGCNRSFTTQVESATQNPVWAAKHVFANISHQDFLDVHLQVSVWNFSNSVQHECIGKAYVDPSNVLLDGSMQWWPLEVNSDQKIYQDYPHPRLAKKSNQALFRLDTSFSYSYHFGNVPSLENCYLTPESASRKSSSNSISAYSEPGIAFVHSEPATPAFVPQAQKQYLYPSVYNDYNHLHRRKSDERYNRLRRKTNKYNREYNQYLLAAAEQKSGGNFLGATMDADRHKMRRKSDCGLQQIAQFQQQHSRGHFEQLQSRQRNKRNRSLDRSNEQLDSMQLPTRNAGLGGSHYGLNRSMATNHFSGSTTHLNIQLGPLQLPPHPHFSGEYAHCGELKLGFFLSDDYLEVEIVSARELPNANTGRPDTFVTTQLVEEDRCFLTRRSGIIRQLTNPLYRHTVKYLASDVSRRILMASVWAQPPPEMKYDPSLASEAHEECIGVAKINIDKLAMRQLMVGWYKLFPPLVM